MTNLKALRACKTLTDLAHLLGIKASGLSYLLYVIPDKFKYESFDIPKKSGGVRVIHKPTERLKEVQRRLAGLLGNCLAEIEGELGIDENCAFSHGFHAKRSIITNARRHRRRRHLLNVDLKDFFDSFNFGRVQGYFHKNRYFQLEKPLATIIAQIACYQGRLPQGSPCSPVITNLICQVMDVYLGKLASKNGCTYTRYADDISFSTNKLQFPTALAVASPEKPNHWIIGDELRSRAYRSGFEFQHCKTRMQYRDSRQTATGLIVNEKLGIPSEYYKTTRAMCNQLFATGSYYLPNDKARKGRQAKNGMPQLRGRLAHIFHIKGLETDYKKYAQDKRPSYARVYKKFLDFLSFYRLELPTIICEGKTDPIYIQNAIKARFAKYPQLVSPTQKGSGVNLRFFSYSKTTGAVQGLSGGAGELAAFITQYSQSLKPFQIEGKEHPVIIVVDNDGASKPIFSVIKSVMKLTELPDGASPFYHVCENLYVVPIPKKAGKDTEIEDLFDTTTLSMDLNGKTSIGKVADLIPKFISVRHCLLSKLCKSVERKSILRASIQ